MCTYVSHHGRLYYGATDKTVHESRDPTMTYHFIARINNMTIAYKIAKQVWDA